MNSSLSEIAIKGTLAEKKALFQFDSSHSNEKVLLKFDLWSRYFVPDFCKSDDAPFHRNINLGNLDAYRSNIDYFVDIAFRGAGKDVKTKLFIAYCILNDTERRRRYYKVLSEDLGNAKTSVTDIYNIFVRPAVRQMYPEAFQKTQYKREEQMGSFTTATGIKVIADSVRSSQRGDVQEASRPDFIWFNDFETKKTLESVADTKSIWRNMEEARTGLEKDGCAIYTCNYVSEAGSVHKLVTKKKSPRKRVLIVPIVTDIVYGPDEKIIDGKPSWGLYDLEKIKSMQETDDDFTGERLCEPSASKDIIFDRKRLNEMEKLKPIKEVAGFKIFKKYDPSHRYASGHDVAEGVGLDSSASVFIDFDTVPAQVVGTFYSNTVKPEAFGIEVYNETLHFGQCLAAIENNKFDSAIMSARQSGAKLYVELEDDKTKIDYGKPKRFGWNTNRLTKSKMILALEKAVRDGLIELNDEDLIQEAKDYNRNDLIDREEDPRDVTNHFDLLMAACIAWQMKDFARVASPSGSRVRYTGV